MSLALLAKLLRLLQEQALERVGGDEMIRTDVRLIAAPHRDLKAWSEQGTFARTLTTGWTCSPSTCPPAGAGGSLTSGRTAGKNVVISAILD
jgi:transcriptional regulator with GAF, ATPase, and Fis domain